MIPLLTRAVENTNTQMHLLEEQGRFRGVASAHNILNPVILQGFVNHLFGCSMVQHDESNKAQVQVIVFTAPCTLLGAGLSLTVVSSTALLLSSCLPKNLHEGGELTTTEV